MLLGTDRLNLLSVPNRRDYFNILTAFYQYCVFKLCTDSKTAPSVPNRPAAEPTPPGSRFLPEPPQLYYTICQFRSADCRQDSCLYYLFSILSPVGGKEHHDTLTNSRIRKAAAAQREAATRETDLTVTGRRPDLQHQQVQRQAILQMVCL